ncbi:MAG TPA: hypothetical protein VIW46_03280 [Acidimicrobiia bacterium]|jgi:fermentation-respiration switch protein FrsA (DUF1100 family)
MTSTDTRGRTWLRRSVYALVALVALFYLGGGYYFAELLRTDGLAAKLPTPNFGVRVTDVTGNSITLDGTDRRAIEHDGTLGLRWADGYGYVGKIRDIDDTEITRDFDILSGPPPEICDGGRSCDEVDLEGYVFPTDPGDVGLAFDNTMYETPLGQAPAWIVPPTANPTGTWAIHVHGWRAERREAVRMLPIYADAGVTSMVAEYRNGPGAPSDPSGLIRFGRTEWEDVEAAVAYALDHGAERIVLVGYSTGAAADMAFLENSSLREEVIGIVFDAPNIDFGRAVSVEASRRTIPGTPFHVPDSLTAMAKLIADLRYDVGWSEIDYVAHEDVISMPTLVFHGANDLTVPPSVSEDLEDRYPTHVSLIVTEGADHVQSWNIDPAAYSEAISDFLGSLDLGG